MNEQFEKNINHDFVKGKGKMNGEKTQNYNTIIDNTGRLTVGEGELRKVWKDSFEDPYNVTLDEQVLANMYGWDVYGSYNYIERPNK